METYEPIYIQGHQDDPTNNYYHALLDDDKNDKVYFTTITQQATPKKSTPQHLTPTHSYNTCLRQSQKRANAAKATLEAQTTSPDPPIQPPLIKTEPSSASNDN